MKDTTIWAYPDDRGRYFPQAERAELDAETRRFCEGALIALLVGLAFWAAIAWAALMPRREKKFDPPGSVVRAAPIQKCYFQVRPSFLQAPARGDARPC